MYIYKYILYVYIHIYQNISTVVYIPPQVDTDMLWVTEIKTVKNGTLAGRSSVHWPTVPLLEGRNGKLVTWRPWRGSVIRPWSSHQSAGSALVSADKKLLGCVCWAKGFKVNVILFLFYIFVSGWGRVMKYSGKDSSALRFWTAIVFIFFSPPSPVRQQVCCRTAMTRSTPTFCHTLPKSPVQVLHQTW